MFNSTLILIVKWDLFTVWWVVVSFGRLSVTVRSLTTEVRNGQRRAVVSKRRCFCIINYDNLFFSVYLFVAIHGVNVSSCFCIYQLIHTSFTFTVLFSVLLQYFCCYFDVCGWGEIVVKLCFQCNLYGSRMERIKVQFLMNFTSKLEGSLPKWWIIFIMICNLK